MYDLRLYFVPFLQELGNDMRTEVAGSACDLEWPGVSVAYCEFGRQNFLTRMVLEDIMVDVALIWTTSGLDVVQMEVERNP